jgi:hypothetical protein
VDAEKLDLSLENAEKLKLMKETRDLRLLIAQYEVQLKAVTEKVKRAILENDKQTTSRMWKIHDKIDKDTQDELLQSKLLPLLQKEEYDVFLRLVKKDDVEKQHFELHALFLTYESIGATWKLIEDKKGTEAFRAEKLMHDLRLFQTIETHNEHIVENYTTKYFIKFLEAFKLWDFDPEHKVHFIETF